MALTDAQRLSVFEILDIMPGPGGGTQEDNASLHNGFAESLTLTELDNLRDKVDAHIAGLTSAAETRVIALVTEWDALGLNVGVMDGGLDDISGLAWSYEQKRALITKRMYQIIPVMKMADAVRKREQASNGGGYVPFIR